MISSKADGLSSLSLKLTKWVTCKSVTVILVHPVCDYNAINVITPARDDDSDDAVNCEY